MVPMFSLAKSQLSCAPTTRWLPWITFRNGLMIRMSGQRYAVGDQVAQQANQDAAFLGHPLVF